MALTLGGLVPWRVSAQASTASNLPVLRNRIPQATPPPSPTPSPTPAPTPSTFPAPVAQSAPAKPADRVAASRHLTAAVYPRHPVAAPKPHPAKAPGKIATNDMKPKSKASRLAPAVARATAGGPAIVDPSILQAAGIAVGPYAGLIAALTPTELVQYVATERRATGMLLDATRERYKSGVSPASELLALETKAAQLDILLRAAERLAQAPPSTRRADLYAVLTPTELLQFLRAELQGARSLRDLTQAQVSAGIAPSADLLPLEARTQQLEILARAAERRIGTHE